MSTMDFHRADSSAFVAARELREHKENNLRALVTQLEDLTDYAIEVTMRDDGTVTVNSSAPHAWVPQVTATCSIDHMMQWLDGFKAAAYMNVYVQERDTYEQMTTVT